MNINEQLYEMKAALISQQLEENREKHDAINRSVYEQELLLKRYLSFYSIKRSKRNIHVRLTSMLDEAGNYHKNLRQIEVVITKEDGSIHAREICSHLFFDEVVLQKWHLCSNYSNISWYAEHPFSE